MLRFFQPEPKRVDLVFVANASAAIKLMVDCMLYVAQAKGRHVL